MLLRFLFVIFISFSSLSYSLAPNNMRDAYKAKDYNHLIGMTGFEESLLKMHFQLYQGYVKQTNFLLETLDQMRKSGQASTYQYGALKRRFGFEFDGMRLHELYFENLGGKGIPSIDSALYKKILSQYQTFEAWKKDFIATGTMRGIGWAALIIDPEMGNLINIWIDEHEVNHLATTSLLLVMDVWEHAFLPQFGLDRLSYIDTFFKNIDWDIVQSRFDAVPSK